jgi:polyvinyl alcohol dehydrogenase (cytochrome)
MMGPRLLQGVTLAFCFISSCLPAPAQEQTSPVPITRIGEVTFARHCTACHGNPNAGQQAPDPATLEQLTPEAIYAALSTGVMRIQGQKLTDEERQRVAEFLSGRPLGSSDAGDAKVLPNRCSIKLAFDSPPATSAWNGWGVDVRNTRFQPGTQAGLSAEEIPKLKLRWAFGFPGGVSAWGQPAVMGGRVFVGADTGYVYSLSARTGCVYWSFHAEAAVRTAISIGPLSAPGAARYAVYFGDLKANVYALDASTGKQLWIRHIENHYTARITGAPTLYRNRLYVPVSSIEEVGAWAPDYPCCTFRGSVVALDATSGRRIWKSYIIPEKPKPIRKNASGTQLWAPAGASVWNSPTIDAKRQALYVGTGGSYTEPAAKTTDSIISFDLNTGKVLWTFQGTENDAYLGLAGCAQNFENRSENCPKEEGPDWDFGSSAILRTLPGGHRILLGPQKSGNVFGLDPDRRGALIWKVDLAQAPPSTTGLIAFGGAADGQKAYFALTSGSMVALSLTDGKSNWSTPVVAKADAAGHMVRTPGPSAAVSAIPGVVFVADWDGTLRALSTEDGRIIWEYDTARDYKTVNEVAAKGGSMGSAGAVVAGGMLFVGSGYGLYTGTKPGNVLLAFSPE